MGTCSIWRVVQTPKPLHEETTESSRKDAEHGTPVSSHHTGVKSERGTVGRDKAMPSHCLFQCQEPVALCAEAEVTSTANSFSMELGELACQDALPPGLGRMVLTPVHT